MALVLEQAQEPVLALALALAWHDQDELPTEVVAFQRHCLDIL
jgi:hypothetical protein